MWMTVGAFSNNVVWLMVDNLWISALATACLTVGIAYAACKEEVK